MDAVVVATEVATGPQEGQGAEALGHRVSGWERQGVYPERKGVGEEKGE